MLVEEIVDQSTDKVDFGSQHQVGVCMAAKTSWAQDVDNIPHLHDLNDTDHTVTQICEVASAK